MGETVAILGKTYTVDRFGESLMQGLMGSAKRTAGTIHISTDQSAESAEETLLHEIIHIVDGELSLGLSEETVARLAVGIYSAGCKVEVKHG